MEDSTKGSPSKPGPATGEPFVHHDPAFTLTLSATPDRMKLFLAAEPIRPVTLTRDRLLEIVALYAPVNDIVDAVLDEAIELLKQGKIVRERRIKRGREPVIGTDGKVVFLVKPFGTRGQVSVDGKGFATSHDLHLFDNIKKGQSVARVYPARTGAPGKDVFGTLVPAASGKPAAFATDASCTLEAVTGDNYQVVVAQIDGYLSVTDGGRKAKIEPELVVSGDLDSRVGSLNFIGQITITGDVKPGLDVHGRLGVTVRGGVTGSSIRSTEGPVTIQKFMVGSKKSEVSARGPITVGLAQNARIATIDSITIKTEARDCRLNSEVGIYLPAGDLIGGETHCVCGLEVRRLGSPAGADTKVFVETDVETTGEFAVLKRSLEDHEKAIGLLDLHLGPYAKNPTRVQLLKEPFKGKMTALLHKRSILEQSRIQLLTKHQELLAAGKASAVARINVHDRVFPGVQVFAGDKQYKPLDEVKGPISISYDLAIGELGVGPLKPIVCDFVANVHKKDTAHEPEKK